MDELIYKAKKFGYNYFNLKTKCNRTEFNKSLLIYSVVVIAILALMIDFSSLDKTIEQDLPAKYLQAYEGTISNEELANMAQKSITDQIPAAPLNLLALLLLPLYIRRMNDTMFHTIGFMFPIVVVYSVNALHSVFGITLNFGLYQTMSLYSAVMVMILCIAPTKETFNDDI